MQKKPKYVINYSSSYGVAKEIFPICTFEDGITAEFEGLKVKIPKNYNYVLTRIYSDYMKLPPESKRISRHSIYDVTSKLKETSSDLNE